MGSRWHPKRRFPDSLLDKESSEKLHYFDKGFVLHHQMIEEVFSSLKRKVIGQSDQSIALVSGPTGVGKTLLCQMLMEHYWNDYDGHEDLITNLPAIYIEASVSSIAALSMKDFYIRLLHEMDYPENIKVYGFPVLDGSGKGKLFSGRKATEEELARYVETRLEDYNCKCLIIDEFQHFIKFGGKLGERLLDILKGLSNKTGCKLICVGTYESVMSLQKSAQLARRTIDIEFPAYSHSSDYSNDSYLSAFLGLLSHVPIKLDDGLLSHKDEVFVGCCGCIGILKQWVYRALSDALNSNDSALGIKHFYNTKLANRDLLRIAEEIKEGKAFYADVDLNDVSAMLGVQEDTLNDRAVPSNESNCNEAKILDLKAKKNRRPGERKPVRDICE